MYNIITELGIAYEVNEDFVLFTDEHRDCTYNEFVKAIVSVAMFFDAEHIRGKAVCIKASHKVDTIICMLGVLLSGNYYVPVSDEAPDEFIRKILEQVNVDYKIDNTITFVKEACVRHKAGEQEFNRFVSLIDDMEEEIPMYIVFTSGSTGIPKGIIKSALSLMDFLTAYADEFGFDNNTLIGNQTPFYFDASVKDIYLTLYCKAKMVVIPSELFLKPMTLAEFLNESKINIIQWVPSALCMLSVVGTIAECPPKYLKKVLFVGEAFPIKQLKKWMEILPDIEYINLYGSSEIAGICTFSRITRSMLEKDSGIPIGQALSNYKIYLADNDGNIITDKNAPGIIYVSGKAVADGYVGCKDSSHVFVDSISGQMKGEKLYCSGDIASYNDDGLLVLKGRSDYQIKHMGHRIELFDIENAVEEITDVESSICIYDKSKIILYYSGSIDKKALLTSLKNKLPAYMIPNKVVLVDKIPLNANGKKDRMYFINNK